MVVVLNCTMGIPDNVVVFDDQHDSLPYIKEKLKKWSNDVPYLDAVDAIATVEEAMSIVEEEAMYDIQIYEVDELNPLA